MVYTNFRRDGCSFMWHQPCQRCKYTTSVDIKKQKKTKKRAAKLVTHVEPHASAVSLFKRAENSRYISDHQSIKSGRPYFRYDSKTVLFNALRTMFD